MSETDNNAAKDLASLKLPELRKMAADKGLRGVSGLRKGDLITAIKTGKVPAKKIAAAAAADAAAGEADKEPQSRGRNRGDKAPAGGDAEGGSREGGSGEGKGHDGGDREGNDRPRYETRAQARRARRNRMRNNQGGDNHDNNANAGDKGGNDHHGDRGDRGERNDRNNRNNHDERGGDHGDGGHQNNGDGGNGNGNGNGNGHGHNGNGNGRGDRGDRNDRNDRGGRRGRRNRRNRRNRGGRGGGGDDLQIREGDELQAVGGILEVVDNNVAFLRTSGYRAGASDVFVNHNLVRKLGLRSGDALTGQVKVGATHTHGNGRNRRKYNQLVRVDSVNGMDPEEAKQRPEFGKLTPLYPNKRLRLETEPKVLTTRVIDLIMPIGKGQRALIVSPPKAGKTTILQNVANAIATNNPECYLMVVLVDERPEEVTDMQRSVKGEVIASTFDRPPSEHTSVAELAIERAKRLVEQGKDVVVLLDSITRLGRAYNNSSPASGRILSGGVDSNALYPPKRFLGAARNIEEGGSLTIIATAMVETGSTGDTVIFEEFKGTGNAELKLDRGIAERRVFPAVDVKPSGTRKDELLLVPEEARIMTKLRRILSGLESQQAIDLLIKQLKKTKSNGEFLMGVASSAPMAADKDEEDYS